MNRFFQPLFEKVAYPYRLLGYAILFFMVFIYQFQHVTHWQKVFYLPFLFLFIYLLSHPVQQQLKIKFKKSACYASNLLDACVFFIALNLIEFNFIISILAMIGLFYSILYQYRNIERILFCVIIALVCFMMIKSNITSEPMINITITDLIAYLSLLILYIFTGAFMQSRKIKSLKNQNQSYYKQMTHYMDFSNQLSRYAPSQLWQSIIKGEAEAKIEYKRKKMTIFFSDIQGFTQLSETLIPEDLAYLLNEYLRHMTQIARQYNATIDKFMGDGILMFFGDIDSNGASEDAKTCVEMALAMRQQMKILRERWQKMGYPPLHIRMGITTGYCHVGNYGTTERMAYTIVGREANLASRIQSNAEIDEILVADSTYQLIRDRFLCIEKPAIYLKGIAEPIRTWQVFERYESHLPINTQQWFDYEYKGFHLILDLTEIEKMDYDKLIQTLEMMIKRLKLQQQLINEEGAVQLRPEDKVDQSKIEPSKSTSE